MTGVINVAVIGAGRIGQIHATNLARHIAGARLVAIADMRLAAATDLARRLNVRAVDDHRALFTDASVDAVIICSSTDTHAPFIAEAAMSGKQIFCEKPIDHDLQRIDAALDAVNRAGVMLQVGFNRRFDPGFRAAREAVAVGTIGTPHLVRITSRDPAPPPIDYIKVSGGLFLDMTIHDFDMARFLLGDEVVEVYAVGGVLIDDAIGAAGDIDTAVVTLRFAGGAFGVIDNSRRAVYGYDQRVEVSGAAGAVMVGNRAPHTAVVSTVDGVHAPKPFHFFTERYAEAYVAEMQAFVDAVRGGREVPVSGADGRAPVVLALAAQRSLAEGRPVRIAEIDSGSS